MSNEGGLNTRLSERNTQIDALNQQLQTLNQSQAGYQELIENQKVQLGQAQEQKLQLDQLRQEQLIKDQDLLSSSQQLTHAQSRIAELEMANRKDESLINERNLQITELQQANAELLGRLEQSHQTIKTQNSQLGQAWVRKIDVITFLIHQKLSQRLSPKENTNVC